MLAMAHPSPSVLHSLAKLERLEPAIGRSSNHSNGPTALPPLPSSQSAITAATNGADEWSVPLLPSRPTSLSLHGRHSHSASLSPSQSPRTANEAGDDDEEEARLHAQYRLKQRLKEKSRREAGRQRHRQPRTDSDDGREEVEEDDEEREARLTSLAHCNMPASPTIRTRSLRPSAALSSSNDSGLPPLSPRLPLGEMSILHSQQKQRMTGSEEQWDEQAEDDVPTKEEPATSHSNVGMATPCLRVAKRLPHPTVLPRQPCGRSDSMQSPLSYSSFSPSLSPTLSTAAASPTATIPSVTRSVSSHYSSIASPYSSSSSFHSPLPASPAVLPSVLHSPVADGGKQRMSDSRPVAAFIRRSVI